MTSSYLYFIVPIVAIVLGLKCCLLCWRIHYNQQRRNLARQQQLQQAAMARAEAARSAAIGRTLTRVITRSPDGTHHTYIIPRAMPSSARPTITNCRTIGISAEDLGLLAHACRRSDPNLPPTYDQAISGRDKSVKLEDSNSSIACPPNYTMGNDISDGDNDDVRPLIP